MNRKGLRHLDRGFFVFLFATAVMVFVLGFGMSAFAEGSHSHNGVVFQAWDSDSSLPVAEGYYYLTKDVTLYQAHQFRVDTLRVYDYHLCLNGHTIKIAEGQSNKNIQVGLSSGNCRSTLSIYDCRNSGTIEGQPEGYGPANAGGIAINPGSTLNLYGGTITNCTADNGGGVSVYGTFNMYGGKICECLAKQKGGAVYVNGTFNMYGGTIEDCIVRDSKNAGGVYVSSNANAVFSLSGSPVIKNNIYKSKNYSTQYDRNIYLDTGKTITIAGELTNTDLIGVMCKNDKPYAFTTGYNSYMGTVEPTAVFKSDDSQFVVSKTDAGEGKLVKQYDLYVGGIQVTDDKLSDDSGWNFNPTTYTLSLNNYTSDVCHSGSTSVNAIINYEGTTSTPLTISFTGTNTLNASDETNGGNGIYSNSRNIILEGNGTLNIKGNGTGAGVSLRSSATLIINSGTITAEGYKGFSGKTTINGGDVTAIATGTVAAALDSTLTNAIPGKGWNNADWSDDPEVIDVSSTSRYVYKYYKAHFPHAHMLTYSASGATITAICNAENCDLPLIDNKPTATLTIAASGGTYDGTTAYGATITDTYSIQGEAKVQYQKKTGESAYGAETETAPVDAGDYMASITLGDGEGAKTAYVVYTIEKVTPDALTPDAAAEGITISYTDETATAKDSTGYELADSDQATEGSNPLALTAILDGAQTPPTYYVRTAETDKYKAGSWVAMQLSARPDVPTNLTVDNASTLTAEDGAINNTNTGMQYRTNSETGVWTDASNDKTVVKAGTYLVRYKAVLDESKFASKTVEVTVGSREILLSDGQKPTPRTGLEFTGSEQALLDAPAEALPEGATEMRYALGTDAATAPTDGWSTTIPTATNAGTYFVWYMVDADDNHIDTDPACVTVTIAAPGEGGDKPGDIKTETHADPSAYNTKAENLNQLAGTEMTDDEKKRVEQGETFLFYMEVKNIDGTVSEADKALIEQAAIEAARLAATGQESPATILQYLDISLFKQIGSDAAQQIHQTQGDVSVTVDIPEDKQAEGRIFFIARIHDGKVEIIAQGTGKSVTCSSNLFSTYALLYVDPPKQEAAPVETMDTLLATLLSGGEDTMNLTWTTVPDATGYDVFFGKTHPKYVATVTGNSYSFTGLKKGSTYRAFVKAAGQTSPMVQCYTDKGAKPGTNPAQITLYDTELSVTISKTARIRSTIRKPSGSKGHYSGRRFYVSSDPSIAMVNRGGRVKGVSKGECNVYVMNNNGVWQRVKITVDTQPTKVAFNKPKKRMKVGESQQLNVKLTPKQAETTLTWESSDPTVVTVDKNGTVTATGEGRAIITATAENGKTATATILVKGYAETINENPEDDDAQPLELQLVEPEA